MAYNKKAHLRDNIEAIRLMFRLEKEQRTATPEEAGTLAAYSCEWLELKNASVVDNITGETSADGLILLPEERIDFIQITEAD